MLKKSMYNIYSEDGYEDQEFIFNTRSRAFATLTTFREYYDSHDRFDPEDETHKKEISNMKTSGFLIDEGTEEIEMLDLLEQMMRFNTNSLGLTIAPTLCCNFDCPYCYEQKNGHRMSKEVQDSLISYITKQVKNIRRLHVTWYGGEPLLEFDAIRDLSKKILSVCSENKVDYSAGIVTNGYLLTEEKAQILYNDCNVKHCQITIDGYQETNNQRRRLKGGGDTFSVIVNNIDQVKDFFPISIRVNTDKNNVDEIETLWDFYNHTMHWNECKNLAIYFAQVTDDNGKYDYCFSKADYSDLSMKLYDKLYLMNGHEALQMIYPQSRFLGCGAMGPQTFVVDPDGYFYKCWEEIGIEKYRVGSLEKGMIFNPWDIRWLTLKLPKACHECKFRPLCGGGCPHYRIERNNSDQCVIARYTLPHILKMVYEDYQKTKKPLSVR